MTRTKWYFNCIDNSGKRQHFIVSAGNKTDAIKAGLTKARKYAKGDITVWNCNLQVIF